MSIRSRVWEYKGCRVEPVRLDKPKLVGYGYTTSCWKITFPDGSWCQVDTKRQARSYIEKVIDQHQPRT